MNNLPETEPRQGEEYTLWSLCAAGPEPLKIEALVNKVLLVAELDTGASVSIISDTKFNIVFPGEPLEHTDVRLKSYSGELSAVLGNMTATVKVGMQEATLPLSVMRATCPTLMRATCPTLFGRDWMEGFGITSLKP